MNSDTIESAGYDVSYSRLIMTIGGQLLILFIIFMILSTDMSPFKFPVANQVREMIKEVGKK